jgi:hypothetical protein
MTLGSGTNGITGALSNASGATFTLGGTTTFTGGRRYGIQLVAHLMAVSGTTIIMALHLTTLPRAPITATRATKPLPGPLQTTIFTHHQPA